MKALKVMAVLLTALMTLSVPVAAETVNKADNTDITGAIELTADEKKSGTFQNGNEYWYYYTADSDGDYAISVLDKNPYSTPDLYATIFDETGEVLSDLEVSDRGGLSSITTNIAAGKTIYVKISGQWNGPDTNYLVIVQKVEEGILLDPLQIDTTKISETLSGMTSYTMEDSVVIPVNEKVTGELDELSEWIAFETGSMDGAEYTLSAARTTPYNSEIDMILYDSLGNTLAETALDGNGFLTNLTQSLKADSIYYVRFTKNWNDHVEYNLTIKTEDSAATSPSKPASEAPETGEEPTQEDELFD